MITRTLVSLALLTFVLCSWATESPYPQWDATKTAMYVSETALAYQHKCSSSCPSGAVFKFDFALFPCVKANACHVRLSLANDDLSDTNGTLQYDGDGASESFTKYVYLDYQSKGTNVTLTSTSSFEIMTIRIYANPVVLGAYMTATSAVMGVQLPKNPGGWTTELDIVELKKFVFQADGQPLESSYPEGVGVSISVEDWGKNEAILMIICAKMSCLVKIPQLLAVAAPTIFGKNPRALSYYEDIGGTNLSYDIYLGGKWSNFGGIIMDISAQAYKFEADLTFKSTDLLVDGANILPASTYFAGSTLDVDMGSIDCVYEKTCYVRLSTAVETTFQYLGSDGNVVSGKDVTTKSNHAIDLNIGSRLKASFSQTAYSLSMGIYDHPAIILQQVRHFAPTSVLMIIDHGKPETFARSSASVMDKEAVLLSNFVIEPKSQPPVVGYFQEDFLLIEYSAPCIIDLDGILTTFAPSFQPDAISLVDSDLEKNENSMHVLTNVKDGRSTFFKELKLDMEGGSIRTLVSGKKPPAETLADFFQNNKVFVLGGAVVLFMIISSVICLCCCGDKEEIVVVPGAPMMGPPMSMPMSMGHPGASMNTPGQFNSMNNRPPMMNQPNMSNPQPQPNRPQNFNSSHGTGPMSQRPAGNSQHMMPSGNRQPGHPGGPTTGMPRPVGNSPQPGMPVQQNAPNPGHVNRFGM